MHTFSEAKKYLPSTHQDFGNLSQTAVTITTTTIIINNIQGEWKVTPYFKILIIYFLTILQYINKL